MTPRTIPTPEAGPYNQAGLMLVASGKGIYVCMGIPLTSPRPLSGIAVVPISDPDATMDICVAWRKGETSAVVRQFLNCVWQIFPEARPRAGGRQSGASRVMIVSRVVDLLDPR